MINKCEQIEFLNQLSVSLHLIKNHLNIKDLDFSLVEIHKRMRRLEDEINKYNKFNERSIDFSCNSEAGNSL